MSVSVVFPDELLVASKVDQAEFVKQVMVYTEQGKISGKMGAKILDCDRWGFYSLLSENGFSVIDYPLDELSQEAETSRLLAEQLPQR